MTTNKEKLVRDMTPVRTVKGVEPLVEVNDDDANPWTDEIRGLLREEACRMLDAYLREP
jgi:hypothetical protein